MVNAPLYGADGIILDLEDSVHPDAKDDARCLVRHALRTLPMTGAERMVRHGAETLHLFETLRTGPGHGT